ncbi:hypothetical protein DOTSEDRAFT_75616 [Dothistroma septosporum NZE10]|uniref:Uncharacterized protein n=1 Tax=Dothistroma septosporum (strain NZE10 / CBS 128990) TaxID=675120 RepID=M2WJ24_DOTSN|nr:hypothetical protein DOTSEDRAFT_75616 [Dothistroma septosporum NZE10]
MAPKSALLTAGDTPKATKKYIPLKPLTTQGKTLRAPAIKEKKKKNQPREAPPGSDNAMNDDSPPPASKNPKARSFAPPNEADYLAEELKKRQLAKARGQKKESWNIRKKPLTTQQKIKAAIAIRKAKGGEENANLPIGRTGKRDTPGLMTILRMQDKEVLPLTGEGGKEIGGDGGLSWNDIKSADEKRREKKERERMASVIFQPTMRAMRWRNAYGLKEWPIVEKAEAAMQQQSEQVENTRLAGTAKEGEAKEKSKQAEQSGRTQPAIKVEKGDVAAKAVEVKPTAGWFTDLPDEVRTRIWRLVVVDDKSCIWPTAPTGREQPDLAMTCKQIRQEVLPIYYGLNTFGISLQKEALRTEPAKMGQKKALTGVAAVHKWANTIGNKETAWLLMIRDWAFEYHDPASGWRRGAGCDKEDDSFVVSMRVKPSHEQDRPEREGGLEEAEPGDESAVPVSSADLEVHVEASCFMRGWFECGKCRAPAAPTELDKAVEWMLEAGISADTLYKFANELRGMLKTLAKAKCVRS